MKDTIEMSREKVLAAYRKTDNDLIKDFLESLFGEETFKPKDITERVKTFEDACEVLGESHPLVNKYRQWQDNIEDNDPFLQALLKLQIIVAALNEGWEPQFTEDEFRYYPWFWLYTQAEIDRMDEEERQDRRMMSTGDYQTDYAGFACALSYHTPSYPYALIGSRLCLKSDTLAVYCGKQFIDLWADFYLIRK